MPTRTPRAGRGGRPPGCVISTARETTRGPLLIASVSQRTARLTAVTCGRGPAGGLHDSRAARRLGSTSGGGVVLRHGCVPSLTLRVSVAPGPWPGSPPRPQPRHGVEHADHADHSECKAEVVKGLAAGG